MKMLRQKRGVVWVSTILYILISLAVLSLVLVSVQPIIDKNRDKALCSQSEQMLRDIDSRIRDVGSVEGNKLSLDAKISRGNLIINSSSNSITWELTDSAYQYSEENTPINISANIKAITRRSRENKWDVKIYLDYQGKYNVTYNNGETSRVLSESDYVLFFEYAGNSDSLKQIDVRVS